MALAQYHYELLSKQFTSESTQEEIKEKLNNLTISRVIDLCSDLIQLYKQKEMPKQTTVRKVRITQEQLDEFFTVSAASTIAENSTSNPQVTVKVGRPRKN